MTTGLNLFYKLNNVLTKSVVMQDVNIY